MLIKAKSGCLVVKGKDCTNVVEMPRAEAESLIIAGHAVEITEPLIEKTADDSLTSLSCMTAGISRALKAAGFENVTSLKKADFETLCSVKGISDKVAEKLLEEVGA